MSSKGYDVTHVDELDELPVLDGELTWRPIRRHFGISAFGSNAYTADRGQQVVEDHTEKDGHEELYVVLRGRATFTLADEELDAPAGTLVHVLPGTRRAAVAAEDGTAVMVVGAKPGEVFEPSPWEDIFAAFSYAGSGDFGRARTLIDGVVARHPKRWQGWYNLACFEFRYGDRDKGFEYIQRAAELEPEQVGQFVAGDHDFDAVRDDPRISAITGQAHASGESA